MKHVPREVEIPQRLAASVEANVRWSVQQLEAISDLAEAVSERRAIVLGCVYELESGCVRMLKETRQVDQKRLGSIDLIASNQASRFFQ